MDIMLASYKICFWREMKFYISISKNNCIVLFLTTSSFQIPSSSTECLNFEK